jgi:putative endonuclease
MPCRLPRYYVYLLFSPKTGRVYLGFTGSLRRRLAEHNHSPGNRGYTRHGRPWRLLAVRCFLDRHSAELVERRLKRSRYDKRNWVRRESSRLRKLCARHGRSSPF